MLERLTRNTSFLSFLYLEKNKEVKHLIPSQ